MLFDIIFVKFIFWNLIEELDRNDLLFILVNEVFVWILFLCGGYLIRIGFVLEDFLFLFGNSMYMVFWLSDFFWFKFFFVGLIFMIFLFDFVEEEELNMVFVNKFFCVKFCCLELVVEFIKLLIVGGLSVVLNFFELLLVGVIFFFDFWDWEIVLIIIWI